MLEYQRMLKSRWLHTTMARFLLCKVYSGPRMFPGQLSSTCWHIILGCFNFLASPYQHRLLRSLRWGWGRGGRRVWRVEWQQLMWPWLTWRWKSPSHMPEIEGNGYWWTVAMAINYSSSNNPVTSSHLTFSLYYVFKENQVSTLSLWNTKIFKTFSGSLVNITFNL